MESSNQYQSSDVFSYRSRASSIMSTGTKTSIGTLPQPQYPHTEDPSPASGGTTTTANGIDVLLGRRNFRITARPGSILSISSFDHPAPPYESIPPLNTNLGFSNSTSTVHLPTSPLATAFPRSVSPTPLPPSPGSHPPSPPTPLSPDPESANAISSHYTHVVRTIDANHRAELARLEAELVAKEEEISAHNQYITHLIAKHTQQLAALRHDIDAAYRQELRAREAEMQIAREDCEARIAAAEARCAEEIEAKAKEVEAKEAEREAADTYWGKWNRERDEKWQAKEAEWEAWRLAWEAEKKDEIQRAKNQVEDVWEVRWRDWMKIAEEEARTREVEGARRLGEVVDRVKKEVKETVVREEEERWLKILAEMLTEGEAGGVKDRVTLVRDAEKG